MTKAIYQIRIGGYLRPEWSERFEGMTITHESNGGTILSGPVRAQAALHGLLIRVWNLGFVLVSVNQVKSASKPDGEQGCRCTSATNVVCGVPQMDLFFRPKHIIPAMTNRQRTDNL
jgi:hypothetical protein